MRKYYKDLPPRIQEMALANCVEISKERFKRGEINISNAFSWYQSNEGQDFWENIYYGRDIPEMYLVSEDKLYNNVLSIISRILKH